MRRRVPFRSLLPVGVLSALACNGLLGNADHELSDDASDATADGSVATCDVCGQWGSPATCVGGTPYWVNDACSAEPPSCAPGGAGMTDCGWGSCCTSLEVPGGTYARGYDGFAYTDESSQATVSGFRLDRYEVTVGRFRQFVAAVVGGWLPAEGSGKHTHLNGGLGLVDVDVEGGSAYETGWAGATWDDNLPATESAWSTALAGGTWAPTAGSSEDLPITEVNWYQAYAFCIWDEGFLPSESEWNYAAAGGGDQRAYPWSPAYPPGSTSITCTNANYYPCPAAAANPVGNESPAGDGKWGQSDLGGNVWEWNLDWYGSYVNPCSDCANLAASSSRSDRGGSFMSSAPALLASNRGFLAPTGGTELVGVRCARVP